MTDNLTVGKDVALNDNWDSLIKEIAMDIGKEVVHHAELYYPKMFENVPSTAKLSIRNNIYNQIMSALEVNDADEIVKRLERRKKFRRQQKSVFKKLRENENDR